jgi:hypothetical protein
MAQTMVEDVAKRGEKPKPKAKPAAEEKARKPMVLQVRGSDDFKAWFEELARFDGLTPTGVFDRAVRRYAKEVGFLKDPPLR